MYIVGITGNFTATHALIGDVSEHEKQPHAHDYKLEWILEITGLDERGFSIDISLLERLRDTLIEEIKGINLNEHRDFQNKPVSLEKLSEFMFNRLLSGLINQIGNSEKSRIGSMEIRIWENDHAWAGIKHSGDRIGS